MSFDWSRTPTVAVGELADHLAATIELVVARVCLRFVPTIEAWMKQNATWTDRTGNARQSLWADVDVISRQAVIVILSHGVDYGVFLELSHGGRYQIIGSALDHFSVGIWRAIRAELGI